MVSAYVLDGFAIPEGLAELQELLARASREHPDVGADSFALFETAVLEIANNVVEHGRPEGKVRWQFELRVTDEALEATLSDDSGAHFTGDLHPEMPDELAESGRGLALASALLESLEYERRDGTNHWHMVARRPAG